MKIGKKYLVVVEIGQQTLTFTCLILDINDKFVSFIDKYGKEFNYNLNKVVSFEEVVENA